MRELEEASGLPARLIRYLISEEVLPPPSGTTRSAAYDDRHVERLRLYAGMKSRGVTSLDVIRAEMARTDCPQEAVTFEPAEGVSVRVEPGAMEGLELEAVLERIRTQLVALGARSEGSRA